jgi:pilus assembly protein Flp/PilA
VPRRPYSRADRFNPESSDLFHVRFDISAAQPRFPLRADSNISPTADSGKYFGAVMKLFFTTLWRQDEGATAVEYAVMLALILIAVISAIGSVGASTGGMWGDIDSDLVSAGFGS